MARCIFRSHSDGKERCWDKNPIWSWHCGLQTRCTPRASVCGIWWDQTGNVVGVMTSGLHSHMQGPVSRMLGHSLQSFPLMGWSSKYCRLLHGEAQKQTFSQHAESHFQAETMSLAVNEFSCIYPCSPIFYSTISYSMYMCTIYM